MFKSTYYFKDIEGQGMEKERRKIYGIIVTLKLLFIQIYPEVHKNYEMGT